jgi:hypothetical protein
VRRFLTCVLVFVLAGVPAAAVVCDLMLCVTPQHVPCHDHARQDGHDARVVANADGCNHLVLTAPYTSNGFRLAFAPVTLIATAVEFPRLEATGWTAPHVFSRGSPPGPVAFLAPLRI